MVEANETPKAYARLLEGLRPVTDQLSAIRQKLPWTIRTDTSACASRVKLRHRFPVARTKGQLHMEVGLNLDVKGWQHETHGKLFYSIPETSAAGPGEATLDTQGVTYSRHAHLCLSRRISSIPLTTTVGLGWDGTPAIQVTLGCIPLVTAAAAALLASGRPISLAQHEWQRSVLIPESWRNWRPKNPRGPPEITVAKVAGATQSFSVGVELDASVQRKQRDVVVSFSQASPVLRLTTGGA